MDLKGEYRILAPRDEVWAMINDPEVLRACIPGCDSLEGNPDDGFTARVTTKIGPVKATFEGVVKLGNVKAPESYTISGEGKGGVAGFAKGGADVHLADVGGDTILTYVARAQVGGKLAQLGARLIDSTAKKLADEFFAALTARASSERNAEIGQDGPARAAAASQDTSATAAPAGEISPAKAAASSGAKAGKFPLWLIGVVAVAVVAIVIIAATR
jgi:carbon monoxide dehydrogenase subunit G